MTTENHSDTPSTNTHSHASFGLRFLAYWVDFLILFILGFVLQAMIGNNPLALFTVKSVSELEALQSSSTQMLGTILGLVLYLAYYLIFLVNYDGATPGKKLLGIKVIKENGEKLTYPTAFIRYVGLLISFATIFFFGIGFLWIIWDKKKQALHDKIAGTLVIREGKSRTVLGVIITLIAMMMLFVYMTAAMLQGFMLGMQEAKNNRGTIQESRIQEELQDNQEKDKDKILSFAPSSCGLTIPVPKTTDTVDGKERKWLYEEVPLAINTFTVLDPDVYTPRGVQGVFIGYKENDSRLGGRSFSVAYPGLNIYCVDNTNSYTLEEYASLAQANKTYKVERQESVYWGEVELIPLILEGKDPSGRELRDLPYLAVSKDGSKLLYVRVWTAGGYTNEEALTEDLGIIVRNLRHRGSSGVNTKGSGNVNIDINSNVKGVNTVSEKATSL